jgi:hypothetical protein
MVGMKHFLPLAILAVLALAQPVSPQGNPPQINCLTQIKNGVCVASGGDNWTSIIPSGAVNGTNAIFTIPAGMRKVEVYLNGTLMGQATEVPSGISPNVTWATTTVTFLSPVPTGGDWVLVRATP